MKRSERLRQLAAKLHAPERRHIGADDAKLMEDCAITIEYLEGRLAELWEASRIMHDFVEEGSR